MTIPDEIYSNLSAPERIRAAISAVARDDDAEKTLAETCPRKTSRMIDAAFGDGTEKLKILAPTVESELQGVAVDFWISVRAEDHDEIRGSMAVSASIESAWWPLPAEKWD